MSVSDKMLEALGELQEAVREVSYNAWAILEPAGLGTSVAALELAEEAATLALEIDVGVYVTNGLSQHDAELAFAADQQRIKSALKDVRLVVMGVLR